MAKISKRTLAAELKRRRALAAEQASKPVFDISQFCFRQQIDFITDPAKFKTAVCSRRAGKTVSCAADLVDTALKNDGTNCLYITLNRLSAKRIIWRDLVDVCEKFELDAKINASELTLTFPNKSIIYISGAKDNSEIEKFRGMALKKVYIDEAQSFRPYIKELINDVLVPALFDYDGQIILIGTPGPICGGAFYEASHSREWSNHRWTLFNNPFLEAKSGKTVDEILRAERKRRGITESDPTYRRESLGEWVEDLDSLVFKYSDFKNHYDSLPDEPFDYVFGVDIGFNDSDAIAVLGYSQTTKRVYLVEELIKNKQDITSLVNAVKQLQQKYKPIKMVMDAGALGKKIQEEIRVRHGLNLMTADKARKAEFIELLNSDLRRSVLMAKKTSRFAEDSKLVQWDLGAKLRNPENPKISSSYHSDITDAVLYAWRECHHFMSKSEGMPTTVDEYMDEMERKEAEKVQYRQDNPDAWLEESVEQDMEALDIWSDWD